jgi:hypothetical protein
MSRMSPELANKRLANTVFLSNQVDIEQFQDLKNRVEGLKEPTDQIEFPDPNEAKAWSKLFEAYCVLKKRRAQADSDPVEVQRAQASATNQRVWNDFLQQRAELLKFIECTRVSKETLEYCGLQPDDLDSPVLTGAEATKYGALPVKDWPLRADRIAAALWSLKNLGQEERRLIPHTMQTRRLTQAVSQLQAKTDYLDQRIASLESRAISKKH